MNGWTVDTLLVHLQSQIDDIRRLLDVHEVAQEKRQDVAREAQEAVQKRMSERLDDLSARIDRAEGRSQGLNAGWVALISAAMALSAVASILALFLR